MEDKKPKRTQHQRIIDYTKKHGTIDRFQALLDAGVFELSSRIGELESKGYVFEHIPKTVTNRFGETTRCVDYKLVSCPDNVIEPPIDAFKQQGLGFNVGPNENNFW